MAHSNRIFIGSVSVRIGTKRVKMELSPAEHYGGAVGLFRVRIDRRWHDTSEGKLLFFDRVALAGLTSAVVLGEAVPSLPPAPVLPRNSPVSVKYWHEDMPHHELTRTATPPFSGFDGRYYVGVMTYTAGFIFVPVDDVTPRSHHEKD